MLRNSNYTMFGYQKSISDTRAKKLASLNIPTLDVSMVENLSNAQSRYLSQFKGSEIDLSGVDTITDEQAYFLSHFKGDKLTLTGLESISDTQAYYLAQFKGSSLILNGLKRITATQAMCLSYFGGKFLNLGGLTSLTVIQCKYLSEFEGDILYLNRVVDVTEGGLSHFLKFGGSCLHIAGIQFKKGKPVTYHGKTINTPQIHLISNYKYMNKVVFTKTIELTDAQKHILEINNMDYKFTNFNIPLQEILKSRKNEDIENKEETLIEEIPTNLIAKKKEKKAENEDSYYNVLNKFTNEYTSIIHEDETSINYKKLCNKYLMKEKSKNKKREWIKFLIKNNPNEVVTISNNPRSVFFQYLAFICLMWVALSISIKSIMENL